MYIYQKRSRPSKESAQSHNIEYLLNELLSHIFDFLDSSPCSRHRYQPRLKSTVYPPMLWFFSVSSQISPLERKATERFELSAENAERKENHGNDKPSPEMEAEDLGRSSESSLLRESSTKEAEVKAAYPLPYPDSSSGSHIEQPRLNDPYTPSVIFCDALGSYVPLAFDSCDTWEVGSHL
jgi:hypothetical protein